MEKLIIKVGLNEWVMKEANPHVPYSPEEIAADIIRCASDVGDETGLTVVPIRMTVREIARGGSFPRTLAAGEVLYERH